MQIHDTPDATGHLFRSLPLSPAPARDVGRGTGDEETRASGRERELMQGGGFLQQPAEGGKSLRRPTLSGHWYTPVEAWCVWHGWGSLEAY